MRACDVEMRQKGDEVAGMVLDPGGPRHGFRKPMAALVMADGSLGVADALGASTVRAPDGQDD